MQVDFISLKLPYKFKVSRIIQEDLSTRLTFIFVEVRSVKEFSTENQYRGSFHRLKVKERPFETTAFCNTYKRKKIPAESYREHGS